LDVLLVKQKISTDEAASGKELLLAVVSMIAGLIARFSGGAREESALYGVGVENENE